MKLMLLTGDPKFAKKAEELEREIIKEVQKIN